MPATQLVVDEEEEVVVVVAPPPTSGRTKVVARKSVDGIASRVTLAVSCLGCSGLRLHGFPLPRRLLMKLIALQAAAPKPTASAATATASKKASVLY